MGKNLFRIAFVSIAISATTGCSAREVPDPCKLLTLDEVRRFAPEVTTSVTVDSVEFRPVDSYPAGIAIKTCAWRNASNVNQVLLTTKMPSPDLVEPALKKLMGPSGARVTAVPTIGPDAAGVFNGSGTSETLTMLVAQNSAIFLDLRPLGGIGSEKSPQFGLAGSAVKTALDRARK